ncbi:nucleoside deaminase [Sphingobacteriaceae bacterium WQ 2009]|uniref:tRNA-specific adenosine deaminase n=1 Tax=Rhinopithecimicrobium faecis TaxID=2820698 RepID=A0A8T4H9G5_9SPHI|nr:nucleoside deaminase [Sphingobacteriaceae bacterium WQ 2009]
MKYINFEDSTDVASDTFFMRQALQEAQEALKLDEVPIGAVIVSNGKIIGKGHNLAERLKDVTAHAEMQAFTAAANYIGGKYLTDCTLYVTIEPCVMCAGAAYWTHISRIVYGAKDEKRGYSNFHDKLLHPKTTVTAGVLEEECGELVKSFFRNKRK